ncbi:MAG: hypothetical protein HYR75_07250, partial [Gemmatimonadetes bacterium]|nr:hypothetical protein [Gemmatimonadota bacterium]
REQLDAAQTQVTTGHKFEQASQDPTAAVGVMQDESQLSALGQYQRNVGTASARVNLESGVLNQINDLLTRAKELAIAQATGTATAATRQSTLPEVNQLLAQAVQLSNTKDGSEYLFGGTNSTNVPYTVQTTGQSYTFSVATPPPSGPRQLEISAGQRIVAGHDGTQVFGDATSGTLKTLQDLAGALQSGDQTQVTNTLSSIDTAIQNTQSLIGDAGARANTLDITKANITALNNQVTQFKSDLQDVDVETAMTNLVSRQTAYQAAMAATSRVLSLSLTSYL